MIGTSTRNAIRGFGGFNRSEFNYQKHSGKVGGDYSEQDRSTRAWAGIDPLNNPATLPENEQRLPFRPNQTTDWRERTLQLPTPGQVAGGMPRLAYTSADTSMLQWNLVHGLANNDPSMVGMLDEHQIAPSPRADWQWQSEPFLHSDIGVPSSMWQNLNETPTQNKFPVRQKQIVRGHHDHTNLKHRTTPQYKYDANLSTGNHHTMGAPPHPVNSGFRATRGPLERPLLLSDLPQPPQPMPVT